MGICGHCGDPDPLLHCRCLALLGDLCYSAYQVNGSD